MSQRNGLMNLIVLREQPRFLDTKWSNCNQILSSFRVIENVQVILSCRLLEQSIGCIRIIECSYYIKYSYVRIIGCLYYRVFELSSIRIIEYFKFLDFTHESTYFIVCLLSIFRFIPDRIYYLSEIKWKRSEKTWVDS